MTGPEQPSTGSVSERISALRTHLQEHPGIQEIPVLTELATLLFGVRNFEEAADLFRTAAASSPDNAGLQSNLSACYLELGQFEDAVDAADKAISIEPALGAAYANRADAHRHLGQVKRAAADYQEAVKRNPRDPKLLNKAGACMQLVNNNEAARQYFEAALSVAPKFSLAKLNLGLLGAEMNGGETALKQIQDAVGDRRLDEASRMVGNTALAVLKDHQRLAPHLANALETNDVGNLQKAVSETRLQLLSRHTGSMRLAEKIAESCQQLEWEPGKFKYLGDTQHVAFLEAAAHCRLDPHAESLFITLNSLNEGRQLPADAIRRDLRTINQACSDRAEMKMGELFDTNAEAWIHYWHARLTSNDHSAYPGQFKPVPNAIGFTEIVPATPPGLVPGTLRNLVNEISPSVPAGLPRAIFFLTTLIQMHPFKDGNGRLARFICNWQLEDQGMHPLIITSQSRQKYIQGLVQSRNEANHRPLLEAMVSAFKNAQQLLNEFNRYAKSAL